MCLLFSFEAFNIIFGVITFMVLAVFIMVFTTIFRQHHQNSNAPRLTVPATAIGKEWMFQPIITTTRETAIAIPHQQPFTT